MPVGGQSLHAQKAKHIPRGNYVYNWFKIHVPIHRHAYTRIRSQTGLIACTSVSFVVHSTAFFVFR